MIYDWNFHPFTMLKSRTFLPVSLQIFGYHQCSSKLFPHEVKFGFYNVYKILNKNLNFEKTKMFVSFSTVFKDFAIRNYCGILFRIIRRKLVKNLHKNFSQHNKARLRKFLPSSYCEVISFRCEDFLMKENFQMKF